MSRILYYVWLSTLLFFTGAIIAVTIVLLVNPISPGRLIIYALLYSMLALITTDTYTKYGLSDRLDRLLGKRSILVITVIILLLIPVSLYFHSFANSMVANPNNPPLYLGEVYPADSVSFTVAGISLAIYYILFFTGWLKPGLLEGVGRG